MKRTGKLLVVFILMLLGVGPGSVFYPGRLAYAQDWETFMLLPLVIYEPPPAVKPFGPFDFPPRLADEWPFTATRGGNRPGELQAAREGGITVLVALTGSKSGYSDPHGCFSLELWQAALDRHDMDAIQPYVEDGTIAGLYAVDEPYDWDCGPTYPQLDQMCAYAQGRLPGIRCGFNAPPFWLAQGLGETDYAHLGFIFTQSNFRQTQDWSAWAAAQLDEARQINPAWPVYLSINVITDMPSPEQVQEAGIALRQTAPLTPQFGGEPPL
jgi:hypothetical protein